MKDRGEHSPLPRSDGRPQIVHRMPYDLTIGGIQRMIDLWCRQNADRWQIHIVTIGTDGPFEFAGTTVHANVASRFADALIQDLSPDLIVNHDAWWTGTAACCPEVMILHSVERMRQPPPNGCSPAAVIVNCDIQDLHPDWQRFPVHTLALGIDLDSFRPAPRAPSTLICGVVGRLHRDKCPPEFIDWLASWNPGPWRIRFVGNGLDTGYQDQVRQKLAGRDWIDFAGDVPPDRMPSALHELSAVLVATSGAVGETGCYAALEAMACGLPVVARDLPGLRINCLDAPLYGVTDADLGARLRDLDDAKARRQLCTQGRSLVGQRHGLRQHVARQNQVFRMCLECRVSILVPVHDTPAGYLEECWQSIRAQSFRSWELVLVDDGSAIPETLAQLLKIARDPRVTLITAGKNRGIASALNAGLKACRSRIVARMDADDVMLPTRLARQVAFMDAHPDVSILGAQMRWMSWPTGELQEPTCHPQIIDAAFIRQQHATSELWFLNHPTVMYRRRHILDLGGYPDFQAAEDLALWLKAHRAGLQIRNLRTVELHYRLHPAQISRRRDLMQREYQRAIGTGLGP